MRVTEVTALASVLGESCSMIQIGAAPATIETPIEHLQACHRRIEQRLATLAKAGELLEIDRETALAAITRSMGFLDSSGVLHTEDEEVSVFPRLRPKLTDSERKFLDDLVTQHIEGGAIHAELRQLVSQLSQQGDSLAPETIARFREYASRLEALYRTHIQAEDERLTPLAKRCLTEIEILEISREMHVRRSRQPG